jgi:mono/diheme cytochrome c family protein
MTPINRILLALLLLIIAVPAVIVGTEFIDHEDAESAAAVTPSAPATEQQVARGAYLARAGDCMACHTARGGQPYAGGRAIPTPFGTMYAPNITADKENGLGSWSANDFWRALHHGKSKDGSFLYPAFPYTNYTKITREDSNALFAYMQTVTPVRQASQEHELRFPYNNRILLAGWRALYFTPGAYRADSKQSVEWNRGAYLVQGLGHCSACHTTRNAFGATVAKSDLGGGLIPIMNWYAPSLTSDAEAGLGNWELQHITALLKTGVSPRSTVFGPMAEVVSRSLQHLEDNDIQAMAVYLKSLPQNDPPPALDTAQPDKPTADRVMQAGAKIYEQHCAECHKAAGQGIAPAYPPMSGNRALTMGSAVNPIRMVLNGGFPPSTQGNPRPYGMPPFGQMLNDQEVAAVVSYIRNSWDNRAGFVSPQEVNRYRSIPLD